MNITRYPYLKISADRINVYGKPVKKEWIMINPAFDGNWDEECGKRLHRKHKQYHLMPKLNGTIVANVDRINGFSGQTFQIEEVVYAYTMLPTISNKPTSDLLIDCSIEESFTRPLIMTWMDACNKVDEALDDDARVFVCVSRYTCMPYRNFE